MRNVDINIEWAKTLSKDEFVAHFAQNNSVYGWTDIDAEAFWNGLNPAPVVEKPKKAAKTETPTE